MNTRYNKVKVTLTETDRVRLEIEFRDSWGQVQKRQQVSFSRRVFERALRDADITVPWSAVNR